jgi:hypothetical protein
VTCLATWVCEPTVTFRYFKREGVSTSTKLSPIIDFVARKNDQMA